MNLTCQAACIPIAVTISRGRFCTLGLYRTVLRCIFTNHSLVVQLGDA